MSLQLEDSLSSEVSSKNAIDQIKMREFIKKAKCKELGITGVSKFKKPELIQSLETEFFKMLPILKYYYSYFTINIYLVIFF